MNELQIFKNEDFGEVRVLRIDNEPWFVGKDLAKVLGYAETANMRKLLDHEEYKEINPQSIENTGFVQNGATLEPNPNIKRMLLVNESGLYQAIFGSTLPTAKKFKHWVTSEVLPSIRKNGGYIANQEELSSEEIIAKALVVAQKVIENKDKQIEEMKPKALFADSVSTSHTTILIGELAKILKGNGVEIGQNRLFQWLRDNGYLIQRKGTDYNMPTQRSMELGLFQIKETVINHSDGHTSVNKTPKVTGKGQQYFINKILGMLVQ